ncbi:MAG TPA: hypothetical protein VN605_05210, partial [Thermoanaerobaculia bacterium]|nr:hypothetical protein [Thermoanaerobaculia bacterium]
MNGCAYESNVLDAAESGRWSESLRAHVASCESCAAAASVAQWMTELARHDDREHILPDPAVVYLKAQLLGQQAAMEQASRPLHMLQIAAYMTVAAGWAALLTWKWAAVEEWMLTFSPRYFVSGVLSSGATSLSMTFFAI